jgi:hypothetical protein
MEKLPSQNSPSFWSSSPLHSAPNFP